jgi:hypothetical protein
MVAIIRGGNLCGGVARYTKRRAFFLEEIEQKAILISGAAFWIVRRMARKQLRLS